MLHHIFEENPDDKYKVALLSKRSAFVKADLLHHFVYPLVDQGVALKDIVAISLEYDAAKVSAKFAKDYLDKLLPKLKEGGIEYLLVCDAAYFKILTKQTKAEPHFGYVMPCKIEGYEHMQVVLSLNYQQLVYNPDLKSKLTMSVDTLASKINGSHQVLGSNIIHSCYYPREWFEIKAALDKLHAYPELSADIEAFSLEFHKAGIGTISFAWDEHNGIAFPCDYSELQIPRDGLYGEFKINKPIRKLIFDFLCSYKGKLTWHNAAYDVKVLIFTLWMEHLQDTKGLLEGLDIMTRNIDDTKIIIYLATNSTAGNVLGLKPNAHEFAGNWAVEEIADICKIPLGKLLEYNLVDALSTNYVKKKYLPIMVQDKQEKIYRELMLPSLKLILQIELTGMPMSDEMIKKVKQELLDYQAKQLDIITKSLVVHALNTLLQDAAWEADYDTRKAKAKNPGKIMPKSRAVFTEVFNPNSGPQLQRLLYEVMALPVIDKTDKKQPATGAETIEKLINHTQDPLFKELLGALIAYGKVTKILSAFIPAFENGILKADGMRYLHGCFVIGGTVSGRLSSRDPKFWASPQ